MIKTYEVKQSTLDGFELLLNTMSFAGWTLNSFQALNSTVIVVVFERTEPVKLKPAKVKSNA